MSIFKTIGDLYDVAADAVENTYDIAMRDIEKVNAEVRIDLLERKLQNKKEAVQRQRDQDDHELYMMVLEEYERSIENYDGTYDMPSLEEMLSNAGLEPS